MRPERKETTREEVGPNYVEIPARRGTSNLGAPVFPCAAVAPVRPCPAL